MRKIPSTISCALLALGLLVAACAPAATPTPKPTLPVPTPAAPTLAPSPAPTLPQARPTTPAPTMAPATPAPPARPAEEKPRSGGILTALNNTDPPHMDMLQQTTSKMQNPLSGAYNLLISRDPMDETKLVPDLAERWEMSPDGKTYTFYLRKGVKFHDGKPFTAADVRATFERMQGKVATVYSPRQEWWAPIEKVETPDDYSVRFALKHPFASFLGMVADPYIFIFPRHVMEAKGDMKREVVGTGPFKLKQYIGGVSFELVRNPDYYIKDLPFLEGMVWYIVKDASAQYAAIRTGQVKLELPINHAVSRSQQETLKKEIAGIQLQYVPTGVSATFIMNNDKAPFKDVRVRRAVSLATDRQAAAEVIMQGLGEPVAYITGREFRFPKEELLRLPGFRQPKDQDIAEAKRLMAEAGFPKGFKTSLISRNTKEQMDIGVFMSGELAKLGIEASVEPLESGIQFERFTKGAYEAGSYRGLTSDNPDLSYAEWLVTLSSRGWLRYSNPKVNELFEKQRIATDPAERKKMVHEMERIVLDEAPMMNLYEIVDAAIIWPEVRGYKQRSSAFISPLQWQGVWLAK